MTKRATIRPTLRSAAVLVLAAVTSLPAALVLPDGQGRLRLSASLGTEYDTNVTANRDGRDDFLTIGSLNVGYSRTARYALDVSSDLRVARFSRQESFDYSDPSLHARLSTLLGENALQLTGSTVRTHEANGLLGGRTEQWTDSAGFSWRRPLGGRYDLAFTADYYGTRYHTPGLQNLRSRAAGLDLVRSLTPRLSAFVGYRLNEDRTDLGGRTLDRSWTTGLSRQILPKVRGSIRAGWITRDSARTLLRYSGLTTAIDLTWAPDPRFRLSTGADRGVTTYLLGSSLESQSNRLEARWQLTERLSASVAIARSRSRFLESADRTDRATTLSLGLDCHLTPRLNAALSARRTDNTSTSSSQADYHREVAGGSLTYTW